jgi:hypothetical protein
MRGCPHVTVVFWILGIVATTLGETGGDLPVVLRAPPVTPLPRNARGSFTSGKVFSKPSFGQLRANLSVFSTWLR